MRADPARGESDGAAARGDTAKDVELLVRQVAVDFLTIDTVLLQQIYVSFCIETATCPVRVLGATRHLRRDAAGSSAA